MIKENVIDFLSNKRGINFSDSIVNKFLTLQREYDDEIRRSSGLQAEVFYLRKEIKRLKRSITVILGEERDV